MTVQTLLPGKCSKPGGLSKIAVITLDYLQFDVQPTDSDETNDVVEAHRRAAGFPACNRGLSGAGTVGELGLRETGPPTGLPNQISTVR